MKFEAGWDIKAGQLVYIGQDDKVYPMRGKPVVFVNDPKVRVETWDWVSAGMAYGRAAQLDGMEVSTANFPIGDELAALQTYARLCQKAKVKCEYDVIAPDLTTKWYRESMFKFRTGYSIGIDRVKRVEIDQSIPRHSLFEVNVRPSFAQQDQMYGWRGFWGEMAYIRLYKYQVPKMPYYSFIGPDRDIPPSYVNVTHETEYMFQCAGRLKACGPYVETVGQSYLLTEAARYLMECFKFEAWPIKYGTTIDISALRVE